MEPLEATSTEDKQLVVRLPRLKDHWMDQKGLNSIIISLHQWDLLELGLRVIKVETLDFITSHEFVDLPENQEEITALNKGIVVVSFAWDTR